MSGATHVEGALASSDIESVEALLGDLELGGDTSDTVIEPIGELDAAGEDAVATLIAKSEAYEDQPVAATGTEAPAVTESTTGPAKKTRKAKGTAAPKAPKVERNLSALPIEIFQLREGDANDSANRTAVIGERPSQKKIGEKFDNLFQSIAAGKRPSVYTMACFGALYAKGEVTSSDLVAALQLATATTGKTKGAAYNIGTARSQAGQMMALFATVGIATRTKQTLVLNKDSVLASKLAALA